jgi:hypothetical protein
MCESPVGCSYARRFPLQLLEGADAPVSGMGVSLGVQTYAMKISHVPVNSDSHLLVLNLCNNSRQHDWLDVFALRNFRLRTDCSWNYTRFYRFLTQLCVYFHLVQIPADSCHTGLIDPHQVLRNNLCVSCCSHVQCLSSYAKVFVASKSRSKRVVVTC